MSELTISAGLNSTYHKQDEVQANLVPMVRTDCPR